MQAKIFCFEFTKSGYLTSAYSDFEEEVNDFLESKKIESVQSAISKSGVIVIVCWSDQI